MEESPAISPDGKRVAFVARAGSKRQIWHRLLAGGAPLQITRDDVDHEQPRWAPGFERPIYYVPSALRESTARSGRSARSAASRRVASALSGGDISHDGRRIALFRFEGEQIALVVVTRDGSGADELRPLPPGGPSTIPAGRRMIAGLRFRIRSRPWAFDGAFSSCAAADGDRKRSRVCRLERSPVAASGSGVVYSSSAGSTVLYPPIVQPARGRARRHGGPPAHLRRRVLRGARRARVRPVDGEPDPHAIGHLEISGHGVAGGEHTPRRSHHTSDRSGADTFGEPG